jgi:hypothetical protein
MIICKTALKFDEKHKSFYKFEILNVKNGNNYIIMLRNS